MNLATQGLLYIMFSNSNIVYITCGHTCHAQLLKFRRTHRQILAHYNRRVSYCTFYRRPYSIYEYWTHNIRLGSCRLDFPVQLPIDCLSGAQFPILKFSPDIYVFEFPKNALCKSQFVRKSLAQK